MNYLVVGLLLLGIAIFVGLGMFWDKLEININEYVLLFVGLSLSFGPVFLSGYLFAKPEHLVLQGRVLASWVQVIADEKCRLPRADGSTSTENVDSCPPRFSVRAVIRGDLDCPVVKVVGRDGRRSSLQLAKRQGKAKGLFDAIDVCAATVTVGDAKTVKFDGGPSIEIWELSEGPTLVVALGDTGCRGPRKKQNCDSSEWPFSDVAEKASKINPNPSLVVHVGDYVYTNADTWEDWRRNLFAPAKVLLEASPWVMVRGNHERCGERGDGPYGFYLFFGSDDTVMSCASDNELEATYALDLSSALRLIVADSSTAYTTTSSPPSEVTTVFGNIKTFAETWNGENKKVWLATHVPIFAIELAENKCKIPGSTAAMLAAWRSALIKNEAILILSGDLHLYQRSNLMEKVNFHQVAVGTGGVDLDPLPISQPPTKICDEFQYSNPTETWQVCSDRKHGYLLVEPRQHDKLTFRPLDGAVPACP